MCFSLILLPQKRAKKIKHFGEVDVQGGQARDFNDKATAPKTWKEKDIYILRILGHSSSWSPCTMNKLDREFQTRACMKTNDTEMFILKEEQIEIAAPTLYLHDNSRHHVRHHFL